MAAIIYLAFHVCTHLAKWLNFACITSFNPPPNKVGITSHFIKTKLRLKDVKEKVKDLYNLKRKW